MGFDFISWYSMYTLEIDQGLETWISSIIGLQKDKLKEAFHQFLSNILAGFIIFNILFILLFMVITTKKRLKFFYFFTKLRHSKTIKKSSIMS